MAGAGGQGLLGAGLASEGGQALGLAAPRSDPRPRS